MKEQQEVKAGNGQTDEKDRLTGIWNEAAVRAKVADKLLEGGALFLCDIDCLKRINDRAGHLEGDKCLKQMAQILGYLIRPNDILGRIGGDEFVIFMSGCREAKTAREIVKRIEERFRRVRGRGQGNSFSVTAGCALKQRGDTYQTMLERASENLAGRKATGDSAAGQAENPKDNYDKDATRIRKELIEQIRRPGAYCQDYETFKSIYRFIERSIVRSGQKACVILLTVVDEEGKSVLPYEKDILMERLGENIRGTLRIGDVYTQYSSSQYLVLVIDTTEKMADMIADRIRNAFQAGGQDSSLLIHYCYRLQPARILGVEENVL